MGITGMRNARSAYQRATIVALLVVALLAAGGVTTGARAYLHHGEVWVCPTKNPDCSPGYYDEHGPAGDLAIARGWGLNPGDIYLLKYTTLPYENGVDGCWASHTYFEAPDGQPAMVRSPWGSFSMQVRLPPHSGFYEICALNLRVRSDTAHYDMEIWGSAEDDLVPQVPSNTDCVELLVEMPCVPVLSSAATVLEYARDQLPSATRGPTERDSASLAL